MDEEREWIDNTIEKTIAYMQSGGTFDMSLQVTIPNRIQKMTPMDIGYTAGIETNKVAPEWLQKGNEQVDKIITISLHSKNVYQNTVATAQNQQTGETFEYRLNTPIEYVSYPTKSFDSLPDLGIRNID